MCLHHMLYYVNLQGSLQVLDQEEAIALDEFAKLERRIKEKEAKKDSG